MMDIQKFLRFWTEDKGLVILLVSITILMFIIYPIVGNSTIGSVITNIFILISLFSGILTVDISIAKRKIFTIILIITMLMSVLGEILANNFITHAHIFSRVLFLWMLIILIFIKVFGNKPISFFYRIAGSITIYLLLGFIWANMYYFIYHLNTDSFKMAVEFKPDDNLMFNFIYYSFENLTTLGYGDILPLKPILKSLVILEAIVGPLYLAVLIGRLISKQSIIKKID